MIYYIALLDDEYNKIWHYLNPKIPPQLYGRLDTVGFDSLISMLSAFSMLGAELFKEPLTSIEYNTFKISYYRMSIDSGEKILSVIVTDRNEDLNRVRHVLEKLIKMHANIIKKRRSTINHEGYDETEMLLESFKLLQGKSALNSMKRFLYRYRAVIISSATAFIAAIALLNFYYRGFSLMIISTAITLIVALQAVNIIVKKAIKRNRYYRLVS